MHDFSRSDFILKVAILNVAASALAFQFEAYGQTETRGESQDRENDIVAANSSATEEEALRIDDVVVTARRREERLIDVPASISVLSEQELRRLNVRNFDDALLQIPNVNFTNGDTPDNFNISIRGISDLNGPGSTSPNVGIFVDGVLQNGTGFNLNANPRLVDIDRVEVIFGPQGTAFGRGTIGGAVNFVTNKPTNEFEANLNLEVGSFPDFTTELAVNIPVTDKFAVRAVGYGSISNGFIDLPFIEGQDSLGNDNAGGRISARYTPTEKLTVDASVQYDNTGFDGQGVAFSESVLAGDPVSLVGFIEENRLQRLNLVGQIEYESAFGTFRSTTAFVDSQVDGAQDFDFTEPDGAVIIPNTFQDTLDQEFRFESRSFDAPSGLGSFDFDTGLLLSFNDATLFSIFEVADFGGAPASNVTDFNLDIFSFSVFGSLRWEPIENLEISAGARFSRDEIDFDSALIPTGLFTLVVDPLDIQANSTFSEVIPNASIRYAWTNNFSTYFSFATGYRPGGFVNGSFGEPISFEEETADSFEVGFKSDWFAGRLNVSGSGFLVEYNDIQVPISLAAGGGIQNAAGARSVGAELSFAASPFEGLSAQTSVGLAFTEFTDFTDSVVGDLTGQQLPNAPETTVSAILDYEHPQALIANLRPFVRGEYSFRSDFRDVVGSEAEEFDGYDVANFRIGFRGERTDFTLFIENAFDEAFITASFVGGGFGFAPPTEFDGQSIVFPGSPRRFGAQIEYRF
ncbi:MAG: TonB-dependent receptor [Pseudomonadota bacterium]